MEDCELDSSGSGKGLVTGSCKHGDKTSGSIKYGKFVNYQLNCEGVLKSKLHYFYLDICMLTQIKPKQITS